MLRIRNLHAGAANRDVGCESERLSKSFDDTQEGLQEHGLSVLRLHTVCYSLEAVPFGCNEAGVDFVLGGSKSKAPEEEGDRLISRSCLFARNLE